MDNQLPQTPQPSLETSAGNATPMPKSLTPRHGISPKLIGLVVVILLLASAAYGGVWWWERQQVVQEVVTIFTPSPSISTTPDPATANWPTFTSKLLNFSFKYPLSANYKEEDIFLGGSIAYTGKDIYFSDKNSQAPGFSIITNDFTVEDSVVHDFVQGSLNTGNFVLNGGYDEKHQKKRQVASGMYEVVAYENIECSPGVGAFLIVSPPKGSNLKYEAIYLYSPPSMREFSPNDFDPSDPCSPKESAINSKVDYFFNQKDPVLERSLGTAIEIASTFQTQNNSADTSTWKTYTNMQYGFEVKYPNSARVFGDFNKEQSFSIFTDVVSEGTGLQIEYSTKSVEELRLEIDKNYTVISDKEIIFNDYAAKEVIRNSEIGGHYRTVFVSRNNGTFMLTHWIGTYQEILSTFKFTK